MKKRKKYMKMEYSDLIGFYFGANSFKKSQEVLMEKSITNEILSDTTINFITTPVVNGILSIELYLKFIKGFNDCKEKNSKKFKIHITHQVNELFDELPVHIKRDLINKMSEHVSSSEILDYFKNQNNNFIEWRYPQKESLSNDITVMKVILDVLHDYCENIMRFEFDTSKCDESEEGLPGHSITIFHSK